MLTGIYMYVSCLLSWSRCSLKGVTPLWKVLLSREIQSTLVISKSKGPSETLRDRIEGNTNGTIESHK